MAESAIPKLLTTKYKIAAMAVFLEQIFEVFDFFKITTNATDRFANKTCEVNSPAGTFHEYLYDAVDDLWFFLHE
ncbi:MAG TPA: hypothetical protein VK175_03300 [Leadbetterella sp.]|nr:hypothetical protein [Leadbetterella sp.]